MVAQWSLAHILVMVLNKVENLDLPNVLEGRTNSFLVIME